MGKNYWWKHDSSCMGDWYYFCYNEKGQYDYYILDVESFYSKSSRKKLFGNAKFVWGKHEGGLGYNLKPLRALTLKYAKAEFEEIYLQMLKDRVSALNKAKEQAIDEECSFCLYLEKKKQSEEG